MSGDEYMISQSAFDRFTQIFGDYPTCVDTHRNVHGSMCFHDFSRDVGEGQFISRLSASKPDLFNFIHVFGFKDTGRPQPIMCTWFANYNMRKREWVWRRDSQDNPVDGHCADWNDVIKVFAKEYDLVPKKIGGYG
eukprot:TRINITY_DN25715_c0_g1_i2.p1 TRINITY_DN25715_c0_g1~~TRINITY_DN25715_c0_g1_i2.p1  ORF type:complete len:136 (+),score=39.18 TRINITY_DN25715_c0_g1_i2:464-871(+)